MERIQVLIDKLVEQQNQKASAAQMLVTVQLLQKELLTVQQRNNTASTSKVTVVMPAGASVVTNRTAPVAAEQPKPEVAYKQPEPQKPVEYKLPEPEPKYQPKEEQQERPKPVEIPVMNETAETIYNRRFEPQLPKETRPEPVVNNEPVHLPFDPIAETPTLLHHQPVKEVYELIMNPKEEPLSLNDKLKQEKTELGQVLKETPIKDLRKAIGINDKFLFVNELFRGDEAMYERSIKTINNFGILPEAEYWINRELKVKLGWNDNKEAVQHFYHLVRRRFS